MMMVARKTELAKIGKQSLEKNGALTGDGDDAHVEIDDHD